MALRWLDGFESFGVTNGNAPVGAADSAGTGEKYLAGSFASDGNYVVRAGRLGGKSLQVGGNFSTQTPDFTAQDTWIVGFGLYHQGITGGAGTQQIFRWQDGATLQCSLSIENNGEMKFYRGDSTGGGVLLVTSSGAKLRGNVWKYIEVKVKIHNSTGTIDIRVNGTSVLSSTGLNNRAGSNNQATRMGLSGFGTNGQNAAVICFDDYYVCDNTGSNNNDFLGPQKVSMILPTGDHGTNQWSATGTGTTHADRVKQNPHDGNTTYVSDSTSGDTEEWDYADTPSDLTSIKGVQVNTVFETDSGSAFSVKNHVNSGGTTSDSAGKAGVNGSYSNLSYCLETDPNTGSLWTKTNVDACIFGVKTV